CQIVQGNVGGIEVTHDGGKLLRPVCYWHSEVTVLGIELNLTRAIGEDRLEGGVQITAEGHGECKPFSSDLRFQFVGSAFGDHATMIDDSDLMGKLISFLKILGSQQYCRPIGHQATDDLPHGETPAWIEAGGWFI